jgi:hypothetical protein
MQVLRMTTRGKQRSRLAEAIRSAAMLPTLALAAAMALNSAQAAAEPTAAAESERATPPSPTERFVRTRAAQTLVLRYSEQPGEVAGPAAASVVEIYGDGRLLVRRPVGMKFAGTYQTRLDPRELDALVHELVAGDFVDYDEHALRTRLVASRTQALGELRPALSRVTDGSWISIELNLEAYRPRRGARAGEWLGGVTKRVEYRGLRGDLRRAPELVELQMLTRARERLNAMMDRPDLVRMAP